MSENLNRYIKRFDTEAEFIEFLYSNEYECPNISYVDQTDIVVINVPKNCLKFTAKQANSTIKLTRVGSDTTNLHNAVLQYSINGITWNNYTLNTDITLTNVGDYVMFKGTNTKLGYNDSNYHKFIMSGTISASGDITSLLNKVDGDVSLYGKSYCFYYMFYGCTSLTTAPELPATTLANYCYGGMFYGCTSLITAPELPATTLASNCYQAMFQNCTSLTTAPELPATTLAESCYRSMFYGCTSLTIAPELPATTLAESCYRSMFYGCTNLNYIKAMFTTTPGSPYANNWVYGVSSSGTFVKNSAATWIAIGTSTIPSGWTVEYAAA